MTKVRSLARLEEQGLTGWLKGFRLQPGEKVKKTKTKAGGFKARSSSYGLKRLLLLPGDPASPDSTPQKTSKKKAFAAPSENVQENSDVTL